MEAEVVFPWAGQWGRERRVGPGRETAGMPSVSCAQCGGLRFTGMNVT